MATCIRRLSFVKCRPCSSSTSQKIITLSFSLFFVLLLNPLGLFSTPLTLSTSLLEMAELPPKPPSDDSESDTPEKCRMRRLRRIQMRRMRSGLVRFGQSETQPMISSHSVLGRNPCSTVEGQSVQGLGENRMPFFGLMSIQGFAERMEDALFVKADFCRPDIFGGRPLHFFAAYDGHGGSHVSTLCKNMMHTIMEEELTRVPATRRAATVDGSSSGSCSSSSHQQNQQDLDEDEWENMLRVALEMSFLRMDQVALSTCACGKPGYMCGCQPMDLAFAGSTAVVAILAPDHVVVTKCGDSRAVLCRGGRAVPLFLDHMPERPDEIQRIHAAGGKLFCENGVRVYGILNMSRFLGDNFLKSIITSQPQISITEREPEDECLILGTDGIWNVMSADLACEVACTCLRDGSSATATRSRYSGHPVEDEESDVLFPSKSALAAAVLCRLALGRGSCDNISVIVVDLKSQ